MRSPPAASTVVCHVFRLPGMTNPKLKSQTSIGVSTPSRYIPCVHRRLATFYLDENVSSRLTAGQARILAGTRASTSVTCQSTGQELISHRTSPVLASFMFMPSL